MGTCTYTSYKTNTSRSLFFQFFPFLVFFSYKILHTLKMAEKVRAAYGRFDSDADFPDLTKHNNWMAKLLTKDIYKKLRNKATPSGFTIDGVIQTGVDNPGHPFIYTVGCVAGDEESYEVFSELLDPVIEARHGGYTKDQKHKTDLNPANLKGGQLDEKYVLSCRVRTGRISVDCACHHIVTGLNEGLLRRS